MNDTRVDFFLPLYVRDFLAATIGWTAAERGHYLTLLMVQWDQGSIPADLPAMERLSPGVGESWALLCPKFPSCDDGLRRNARLEEHRGRALELRRKRAEAGRKGGKSKAEARPKPGQSGATAKICHLEPEPQPYTSSPVGEEVGRPTGREAGTPPPPARARSVGSAEWKLFLDAWQAGPGSPWSGRRPPLEAIARISEDGWLDDAVAAIERLRGAKYFREPVDLVQFCGPGFVDRVLSGRYDKRYRSSAEPERPSAEDVAERWERGVADSARRAAEFKREQKQARA